MGVIKNKKINSEDKKKVYVLPLYLVKTLELLKENNTTNYVAKKLGKTSKDTSSCISKLIKKGFVRRIDRGVFEILKTRTIKKMGVGVPPNQPPLFIKELGKLPRPKKSQKREISSCAPSEKKSQPRNKKSKPKVAKDFYRLHGLRIELKINKSIHGFIRSSVMKDKIFDNIRSGGNNDGYLFDYGIITYLITRNKIFANFPDTWEIVGDTMPDVSSNLYEAIFSEINKLGRKLKRALIRDGRVCFDITNMHIAISNCGVIKEFKNRHIRDITVHDSEDGKVRFLMDFSHGLPELEAVHPQYAFDDAMEAKYFTNTLATGEFRSLHQKSRNFFNTDKEFSLDDLAEISKTNTELILKLVDMIEMQTTENTKTTQILKATAETVGQVANIIKVKTMLEEQPEKKKKDVRDHLSYVG